MTETNNNVRLSCSGQVPYPPASVLPHLFFGEEVWMLARMWTRGWRVYAPCTPITFHQWERSSRAHTIHTVRRGQQGPHHPHGWDGAISATGRVGRGLQV